MGSVDLQIQDMTTGLWWDPSQSSYRPTIVQPILAAYSSNTAPATSVQWRYTFLGLTAGHEYLVRARTRDANGGISQMVQRTFGMPGTAPVAAAPPLPSQDTTRPNGLLAFPIATPQQTLPFAPITFSGTATDDVGVNQVRISLKRLSNNQYWQGTSGGSGFSSTFRYWDTVLDTPGGTSTGWTWAWTPRSNSVPGDFQLLVQAIDAAGNVDNSTPNVRFTVSNLPPDTVAPDTTVSTPTEGQDLPTGQVSITGTATDNTNVASVRVGIQNSTDQWWNGTAFQAAATTVNANLNTPGTPASNWTYNFNSPGAGTYRITATAVDSSNVVDASPAGPVTFTTSGSPDNTTPGTTTVTAPTEQPTTTSPVTITGNATDNVGVAAVRVYIRLNGTSPAQWWNGTSFSTTYGFVTATVNNPGQPNSTWSYTFTPPAAGSYGLQTKAVDTSGNLSAAFSTWRNFIHDVTHQV